MTSIDEINKVLADLDDFELGKANYNAYCETRDWKSYDDKPLPQWEAVKPEIQYGWIMGAKASVAAHYNAAQG